MLTRKRIGFYLLLVAVVIGAQWVANRPKLAGTTPSIQAKTIDGQDFDFRQLQGSPAVIYFWATWCKICGAMKGTIQAIANDYPTVFVAVQSGTAEQLQSLRANRPNKAIDIADPDGQIGSQFGIRGVPSAFIVDKQGKIRWVAVGYTTEIGLRARLWLANE